MTVDTPAEPAEGSACFDICGRSPPAKPEEPGSAEFQAAHARYDLPQVRFA